MKFVLKWHELFMLCIMHCITLFLLIIAGNSEVVGASTAVGRTEKPTQIPEVIKGVLVFEGCLKIRAPLTTYSMDATCHVKDGTAMSRRRFLYSPGGGSTISDGLRHMLLVSA